jgi:transcription initiation factor IIE alpha subunit
VRYAIANILRDRVMNEGAFAVYFEIDDQVEVVRAILRRALEDATLRSALERAHLVDLNQWLTQHTDLAEAYYSIND